MVFRPPFEYQTKFCPIFKWRSNNRPLGDRTTFDHSNTRLVRYSDPHWIRIKCDNKNQPSVLCLQYKGTFSVASLNINETNPGEPYNKPHSYSTLRQMTIYECPLVNVNLAQYCQITQKRYKTIINDRKHVRNAGPSYATD